MFVHNFYVYIRVRTCLQNRLDVLESGGYPVWITELDIALANVTERAQSLDDLMTLYFSRSIVDGVLLWGFSDNHGPCRDSCSLYDGDDFVVHSHIYEYIPVFFKCCFHVHNGYLT